MVALLAPRQPPAFLVLEPPLVLHVYFNVVRLSVNGKLADVRTVEWWYKYGVDSENSAACFAQDQSFVQFSRNVLFLPKTAVKFDIL